MPEEFPGIVARWNRGEFTAREAARMLGISRTTFFWRVREMAAAEAGDGAPQAKEQTAEQPASRKRRRNCRRPAAVPAQPPKTEATLGRDGSDSGPALPELRHVDADLPGIPPGETIADAL